MPHDRSQLSNPVLEPKQVLKLLNRIGQVIRDAKDISTMTSAACDMLGAELVLDRSTIMLSSAAAETESAIFAVQAEYCAAGVEPLGERKYYLKSHCELNRLLQQGKPIPLADIEPAQSTPTEFPSLEQLIVDSQTKSLVVFPLVSSEKILGLISLHQNAEMTGGFSEEVLELGEALSDELVMTIERLSASAAPESNDVLLRHLHLPAVIMDGGGRIKRYNQHCQKILPVGRKDWRGLSILELIPDAQRLLDGTAQLSKARNNVALSNLLISHTDGVSTYMDTCLSLIGASEILLMFYPAAEKHIKATESEPSLPAQELTANLSRQVSWERWVRQIICKLHSTLDRDTLLQTVVDGFGRALGASRCLIVRTDTPPALPVVTHEYAEPDISPLGLGRTGQFPPSATSYFRHKAAAIGDLTELERSGELSADEYEYFADNGIRSMAGAPISTHGIKYGVIIILESGAGRKWNAHELDMLEIAATQTAVALGHSQQYLQLKDQLFNMNLLGNLTQQLTNTLELVSRGGPGQMGKAEQLDERRLSGSSPPLSLRELEVLKLIASGLANREIAQRLFLTESTVELHASRIRKKLKLKSRTALVKYACDNGLA